MLYIYNKERGYPLKINWKNWKLEELFSKRQIFNKLRFQ